MAEKGGSPGNGDAGLVSSSCLSSGAGMLGLSRIQQNPFAIKTTTPTRSVADSTENKESKPIVAPPTLVLGADNACAVSSSGSRIVLRPSALAFQAEKLKQTSDVASTETKDNSAAASVPGEQQQQQMPSASRDLREVSSTCESTTGPVTNGTRTSSAGSGAEDDNSGSTTTSSSNGRAIGEGSGSFGLALGDLRNGTSSSSDHLVNLSSGAGLLSSAADDANHSPHAAAPPDGFVFGENLRERAANFEDTSSDSSVAPTSTELSFQQFQQQASGSTVAATEQPVDVSSAASRHAKSLTESAEEYQLRQVKRTYDEVAVVTGEENESNVLQINCKLFTFDKTTSSWQERGRGSLRLNDQEVDGVLQSRMVMRTQGSLRVILNTKVWSGMVVEHPSSKTVRTSAIDPDGIRVYLIQANAKDAEQLYSALECRVASLKAAEDSGTGVSPVPVAMQGLPPSADSSSSFPESVGSLEDDGAPQSKRPRLQESDGSLPDSSHGEDSVATAECESSAEDKG